MNRPPKKKPTLDDEDVVMGGDDHPNPKRLPSSAPEKIWAEKVKGGKLLAGLGKAPQHTGAHPKPDGLAIPLSGSTEGGKAIGKDLKIQEAKLSTHLPAPHTSSAGHQSYVESCAAPTWGIGSLESVRTSIGFLEEHLNSLVWIQECLISHQKSLVRTRLFTQTMLDSIGKALYVQNRFKDMKEALTGEEREGK